MQTIARKANESIVIQTPDGDEIRVVVHSFNKDQIKVSVDVSRDYNVVCEELMTDDVA